MLPKQKAFRNLDESAIRVSKPKRTLEEKIILCNEKEVDGIIVDLKSFQGLVEFKIWHRKENAIFFNNRVLVNGKKLGQRVNLMDVMEIGAKVRLKVKLVNKTDRIQQFKVLELEHKDRKPEHRCAITSQSSFSKQSKICSTGFNQVIAQPSDDPQKTTVSKVPYINGAASTVINILSDSAGIILTDPDDGGYKVSFEINNLFINGEKCKAKSLSMCLHLGQSVYCTATKANEKDGVEYKAFSIWFGKRPPFATMLSSYMPEMKIKNWTKTVCRGTVKVLAPPKAAILALDPDNYAVMFLTYLLNIKPEKYSWIGEYVQVGDTLLVKISGHYQNLCFAVSEVWKVNDTQHSVASQDSVRSKEAGWLQNMSESSLESAENNNKSSANSGGSHSFGVSKPQKMGTKILNGRTGKVVSYSSKSRGLLCDSVVGCVKFLRSVVVFPAGLGHLNLQEYIPVGSTVYFNACLLEKSQKNYVCTKLWIGKKDGQTYFQNRSPLKIKCPSTVLTEGESYKAVVIDLQLPYGLIVTVETVDKEVPVYVPLCILQLYPEGPVMGRKCSAYIKCGDPLFINVYYDTHVNERRLNWVASKAWISMSCAAFERQDAISDETKKEYMSTMSGNLALVTSNTSMPTMNGNLALVTSNTVTPTMNGNLALVTSNSGTPTMNGNLTLVTSNTGEISREFGMKVFFINKNAFLFEINLGQMDLQRVFIEGETLHYILPENRNETYMEASKVWYGTFDNKETLNKRIDALIDYWMKRDLERSVLRAMIKELKRQHVEQSLQILSEKITFNSMCTGDNLNFLSSIREETSLNREIKSDAEELEQQQVGQTLQRVLKGTTLSSLCRDGNNLSNACSFKDIPTSIKETSLDIDETENKINANLNSNDTQNLTDVELTVCSRSIVPIALNLPMSIGCGEQQNMIITNLYANRELSTLVFENKHLSAFSSLERKVLHGLLHFLRYGLMSPTVLQEVQIGLEIIHQKYNNETLTYYLFKGLGLGPGRVPKQSSSVKNKKSGIVNLSEQDEHIKTSDTNQYKLKKENYITVNQSKHKDGSIKSRGSKCLNAISAYSDNAQYLSNKVSNDVSEIPFHNELQSHIEHMNNKIVKQKKYANKAESVIVNLSEQEEHITRTSDTNQHKLKKESYIAINQSYHKGDSVKSRGSKCVEGANSDDTHYLLNKESDEGGEVLFHNELQSQSGHMNNKTAKQKKYANKEVQTVSTGDILYFKVVPDM